MTLRYSVPRCAGRFDFLDDGEWCPERDTCQRYLAFVEWDREAGVESYRDIVVSMGIQDCEHKIEVTHD